MKTLSISLQITGLLLTNVKQRSRPDRKQVSSGAVRLGTIQNMRTYNQFQLNAKKKTQL